MVLGAQWVQCDKCQHWVHQICALFNTRRNEGSTEFTCPECCCVEMERGERKALPPDVVLGAKDLPRTRLSDHLEQRLQRRLAQEKAERAAKTTRDANQVKHPRSDAPTSCPSTSTATLALAELCVGCHRRPLGLLCAPLVSEAVREGVWLWRQVPGPEELVIRVVSSVDKKMETKPLFLNIFPEGDYPKEFPYKSKVSCPCTYSTQRAPALTLDK